MAAKLAEWGHEDFTSYVVWACERALERGMLPHTNIGVLERDDLARLREVTASQGLMLESASERLMETVHAGLADQASGAAAGDDRGRGRAEDPVHERDPRRDRRDARRSRSNRSKRWLSFMSEYGHIQEVILQNFVPHPRYYGAEVADIADEAAREAVGGGRGAPPLLGSSPVDVGGSSVGVAGAQRSPLRRGPRALLPGLGQRRSRVEDIKRLIRSASG